MSGMNDELITRLRNEAKQARGALGLVFYADTFEAAADALEAAQAEAAELRTEADVWRHLAAEARSEAAAERALADELARALNRMPLNPNTTGSARLRQARVALAAHRERRTKEAK